MGHQCYSLCSMSSTIDTYPLFQLVPSILASSSSHIHSDTVVHTLLGLKSHLLHCIGLTWIILEIG